MTSEPEIVETPDPVTGDTGSPDIVLVSLNMDFVPVEAECESAPLVTVEAEPVRDVVDVRSVVPVVDVRSVVVVVVVHSGLSLSVYQTRRSWLSLSLHQ